MLLNIFNKIIDIIMSMIRWIKRTVLAVVAFLLELAIMAWLTTYFITESIILTFTPSGLRREKNLRGKIVVLTGGAGGVGQELALRLARLNAKVVIWDINEPAMEKLKENIENEGHTIYIYNVDVSDRKMVYKNADLVKQDIGVVDILINNAGIVCGNTFLDIPDYMIEKTFHVNTLSNYWTVKAFLPDMLKKGRGHLVTVSSLTGMLGTYKCTDYSATKHALLGFHESLQIELKTHGHRGIKTSVVCPYFINTGMFSGCTPKTMPMLEPRAVAKGIITAIKREEVFVTLPGWAKWALPLKFYLPHKLHWALNYRIIKFPQAMMGLRAFQETVAA